MNKKTIMMIKNPNKHKERQTVTPIAKFASLFICAANIQVSSAFNYDNQFKNVTVL
ncbi:hypothetical protein [Streptococcus macacae]|nr:hypothetical protein [Streptococcus macacae]